MPVSANGTHIVFNDNSTQAFGFTGPVAAANITGTITGPQIAPATITAPNIAPGVIPSGGFSNMQVFTSPGTFTTPPTTTKIKVTVVGGGGKGGLGGIAGCSAFYAGGGGAGGAAIRVTPVSAATPYPVTVGTGATTHVAGGTSSFGSIASATGGSSGASCGANVGGALGGSGSVPGATTCGFTISGGPGTKGGFQCGASGELCINPGAGGSSILGFGNNRGPAGYGVAGALYGSGGTGGAHSSPTSPGGNGAAGIVIVEF